MSPRRRSTASRSDEARLPAALDPWPGIGLATLVGLAGGYGLIAAVEPALFWTGITAGGAFGMGLAALLLAVALRSRARALALSARTPAGRVVTAYDRAWRLWFRGHGLLWAAGSAGLPWLVVRFFGPVGWAVALWMAGMSVAVFCAALSLRGGPPLAGIGWYFPRRIAGLGWGGTTLAAYAAGVRFRTCCRADRASPQAGLTLLERLATAAERAGQGLRTVRPPSPPPLKTALIAETRLRAAGWWRIAAVPASVALLMMGLGFPGSDRLQQQASGPQNFWTGRHEGDPAPSDDEAATSPRPGTLGSPATGRPSERAVEARHPAGGAGIGSPAGNAGDARAFSAPPPDQLILQMGERPAGATAGADPGQSDEGRPAGPGNQTALGEPAAPSDDGPADQASVDQASMDPSSVDPGSDGPGEGDMAPGTVPRHPDEGAGTEGGGHGSGEGPGLAPDAAMAPAGTGPADDGGEDTVIALPAAAPDETSAGGEPLGPSRLLGPGQGSDSLTVVIDRAEDDAEIASQHSAAGAPQPALAPAPGPAGERPQSGRRQALPAWMARLLSHGREP